MRYDDKAFEEGVAYYRKALKGHKNILAIFDIQDEDAYYSLAPMSRAAHELGSDIYCLGIDGESRVLNILYRAWQLSEDLKSQKKTPATKALSDFLKVTTRKAKAIKGLFDWPDMIIKSNRTAFIGHERIDFKPRWLRPFMWDKLLETADTIYKQVYWLKEGENVGIGFELIPKKKDLDMPLQDYLDSFLIARAMALKAKQYGRVSLTSSTQRFSQLEPMNKIADLRATIFGCELSKDIDEPVFRSYKKLSKYIRADEFEFHDAAFFISGKGYGGKHTFGEAFGYPDPKKRTRWQGPAMILYQLDYHPQTQLDERGPRSRIGFTSTIPIDVFVETCNIDWNELDRKNHTLKAMADQCDRIFVESESGSCFEVGLIMKDGDRRQVRCSGVDIRTKLKEEYFKRTGIKAGNMANLPGGEMFLTPEYVKGRIVGDVVISIDESYRLDEKEPLVVECDEKGYRIQSGPKKILAKIVEKKQDAKKMLARYEKQKTMPKEIIALKKKNFNNIGEFAINTNPKARLTDYLIVNEKIAGMIHVALGSGFEPDRSTEYHYDIVIDARRQKLDIFGLKGSEKIHFMKKGVLQT
jgi:hypothetical protein